MFNKENFSAGSAAREGYIRCLTCDMLSLQSVESCPRCGDRLSLRIENSIQKTLALVFTAILLYIPANLLPIMSTNLIGTVTNSTILGGVVTFLDHGSFFIAFVIFVASVVIPLAKMGAILWLCYATTRPQRLTQHELGYLYRSVEFIGKWSMVDVFVVAILVALVQLTGLMTIQPGAAITAFSGVVIATMLAAHQFDIRLIWDHLESV